MNVGRLQVELNRDMERFRRICDSQGRLMTACLSSVTASVRRGVHRLRPMSEPIEPLLIDAKRAAVMLGLSARNLWSLTKCNAVPHRKIGRRTLYVPAELRAWIALGCPTEPGSATRVWEANQ